MTDDRLSDDELRAYLQSRIPAPGAGYWDVIDSRLDAVENDLTGEGDGGPVGGEATASSDNGETAPASSDWMSNRNLLAVAALVLVVVIGTFAVLNRSGDDPVDLATASQDQTESGDAALSGDSTNGADLERDLSPLRALQARLAGQVAGVGEEGAGSAGPYCFSSDDAYVFPADELLDRRALVWLDVAFDGTVNYFALQGDTIAISGSGLPTPDGVMTSRPVVAGASSGELAPNVIVIADSSVTFSPENGVLELVPCAGVADRVDLMFALVGPPTSEPIGVSADWPPADAVLSSSGLGPIKIGMSVAELSTVLGTQLTFDTIGLPGAGECGWISDSLAISDDVWIIVELTSATDAIVRRVTVTDGPWSTPSGISVGMTEQNVIDTFPNQIESQPHKYVEGTYLTYQPADVNDPNTVQFVNEGGTIVEIHAGDRDWVGLVEGCA